MTNESTVMTNGCNNKTINQAIMVAVTNACGGHRCSDAGSEVLTRSSCGLYSNQKQVFLAFAHDMEVGCAQSLVQWTQWSSMFCLLFILFYRAPRTLRQHTPLNPPPH